MTADRGKPSWLRDQFITWTTPSKVPAAFADLVSPMAELFGFPPATIAKGLLDAASAHLVGKRVRLVVEGHAGDLDLRSLQLTRPPVAMMIGQLGEVRIEAEDVEVGDRRLARIDLVARNVHIQPDVGRATIVAAPVHARVELEAAVVYEVVAEHLPEAVVELADGEAHVRLRAQPAWAHLQVEPRVTGRTLVVDVIAATVGSRDLPWMARRIPSARFRLSEVAPAVHVTRVAIEGDRLVVDAVLEEWRVDLSAAELDQLTRRIKRYDGEAIRLHDDQEAR